MTFLSDAPWLSAKMTGDNITKNFVTTENLKKRFDAEVTHIPFPQRDVQVHRA